MLFATGGLTVLAVGVDATLRGWRAVDAKRPLSSAIGERHRRLLASLADTLLPASDTPGALDVGVPEWIEHLIADSFDEAARTRVLAGLDAIDAYAVQQFGQSFQSLSSANRSSIVADLDGNGAFDEVSDRVRTAVARRLPEGSRARRYAESLGKERRAFAEIKGLIVHGYFTSKPVQCEIMRVIWA